jgi:PelA/Pel-15E family pectate lyase
MRIVLSAALLGFVIPLQASVLGVSKPAPSLTVERINSTLPASEREPWLTYLRRSQQQLSFDQDEQFIERNHMEPPYPPVPKEGFGARAMPADRDLDFYKTPQALHVAETILSFQLPNGGWSKNLDMSGPARLPGQAWASNNVSRFLGPDDFDKPANPNWNYISTLDNDATNTELHYLARMSSAYPGREGDRFRKSLIRGVYYLLRAQYPNGGWPQVYPLEGGYHDAITFNDNAVTESAELLHQAASGQGDFTFIPADLRAQAAAAAQRAVSIILRTQLVIDGKRTIWAQQHDPLTLAPVSGRNFEPAALSAGESADILVFLMKLPHPSPEVRASIEAGVAWLKANAIYGQAWVRGASTTPGQPGVRHLEAQAGAGPIWARYYAIDTGKPIFGDRDKTIHDNVDELSTERRNGYAWYSGGAQSALDAYAAWKSQEPASKTDQPAARTKSPNG